MLAWHLHHKEIVYHVSGLERNWYLPQRAGLKGDNLYFPVFKEQKFKLTKGMSLLQLVLDFMNLQAIILLLRFTLIK
jgi:hypothetical protein